MIDQENPWLPLPLSLDDVTAEWLGGALSLEYPGTEVRALKVEHTYSGTSTSGRLSIEYGGPSSLPRTLYVKGGFDDAMRRRVWVALAIEARFYEQVAPTLAINIPKGYFAGVDDEARQAIVVLEDLALREVNFGHATRALSADTMVKLMDLLADMHAQWWESPHLANLADGATPQRVFVKYLLRPKYWREVLERPYGHLIPSCMRDPVFIGRSLDTMWRLNDQRSQTLIHGDTHVGNLFFEPDGRPGLMDWQCAQRGHWAHDVMWVIVSAMDIESRRGHERALLRHYLNRLARAGVNAPSFDKAWLAYRQSMMYGASCCIANPYDMQNETVTRISAERVLAALDDLEVVESLGLE